MNYLITAAGLGSRLRENGIKPPKPLVKVKGIELLIWAISSFNFKHGDNLYIVTLKRDNVEARIIEKLRNIYPDINISWLEFVDHLNGQLISAKSAIEFFNISGPLVIHNCDTSYSPIDYSDLQEECFGLIPTFSASGDNWSFAKTVSDTSSLVLEVSEKIRISNNCSVGTYYFKDASLMLNVLDMYLENIQPSTELYIAPFYNYCIKQSLPVKIINARNVKVFGTLAEIIDSFGISSASLRAENDSISGHVNKTFVVDIDSTICSSPSVFGDYSTCTPIPAVVDRLREINDSGGYIILFTSRNMRTFNGSMGLINKYMLPTLLHWLQSYNIPFDELYPGKPWGHNVHYIDDKNMTLEDLISKPMLT